MNILRRIRYFFWWLKRWVGRPRLEHKVFRSIEKLCSSRGYGHTIAFLCFRDNALSFGEELKGEDIANLYGDDRLIRTEISTLIGLLAKTALNLSLPSPRKQQTYVKKTDRLLKEIHGSLSFPMMDALVKEIENGDGSNLLSSGLALREAIFYGGESAYSFQYRDFFPKKYGKNDAWFQSSKGFSVDEAATIAAAIGNIQDRKKRKAAEITSGYCPEKLDSS